MKKIYNHIVSFCFLTRFYLYVIFVLAPPLVYYKHLTKKGEIEKRNEKVFKAIHKWADYCVKIGKSDVKIKGYENVPKNTPVLFVSNHESYADIPMIIHALREFNIGFMLKSTITNIPFIKDYLEYMNCVPVNQKDIRKAALSIAKAAEHIENGKSLLIFPEGKRSFSNYPDEFKNGAFKVATKTGVTVVPIYIHNIHLVYEGNGHMIGPANIEINILPPIETSGMKRSDIALLNESVYEKIVECAKTYK